jgi:hypothetical protein
MQGRWEWLTRHLLEDPADTTMMLYGVGAGESGSPPIFVVADKADGTKRGLGGAGTLAYAPALRHAGGIT